MRNIKVLVLMTSMISSIAYAEVNLMLLSHSLQSSKWEENKKKCKSKDCEAAFTENIDKNREILNHFENPKTFVGYETWSTKEYAKNKEKDFNKQLASLEHINKVCDKNFDLFKKVNLPYANENFDKAFCQKMKAQLDKSRAVQMAAFPENQTKVVEEDNSKNKKKDDLSGCTLSFDQSEISCPHGVYVRSKSITDTARGMKQIEYNENRPQVSGSKAQKK